MKNRSNMLHAKSCESNLENDISDTRLIDYLDSESKYIFLLLEHVQNTEKWNTQIW